MLVVMIGVRKSLDCIFTRRELKILDDLMPEMNKRSDEDLHRLSDDGGGGGAAEVGLFKKFITCCIGERSDGQKLHKVEHVPSWTVGSFRRALTRWYDDEDDTIIIRKLSLNGISVDVW